MGLAFAVMATPAFARPLESTRAELGVQPQETPTVIPYLSHGQLGEAVKSGPTGEQPKVINYLSHGMTSEDALDPRTGIPLSAGIPVAGDEFVAIEPSVVPDAFERAVQASLQSQPVRPDDRVDRFVVGDGTPTAPVADGDGFTVDWADGLTVGLGALALVLALGVAVAYMRRPRIAL